MTYTQKRDLVRQWFQTAKTIGQIHQRVLTHTKVQTGFDEFYENRWTWNTKASLASIGPHINTLPQLRSDLEQLQPVYGRLYP